VILPLGTIELRRDFTNPKTLAAIFWYATNIHDLILELHLAQPVFLGPRIDWTMELPKWMTSFRSLKRLQFILAVIWTTSWTQHQMELEAAAKCMIDLMRTRVGAVVQSHKGASVWTGSSQYIQQKTWEWKAGKGQLMDCSKFHFSLQ
jgi:hypothetical protein